MDSGKGNSAQRVSRDTGGRNAFRNAQAAPVHRAPYMVFAARDPLVQDVVNVTRIGRWMHVMIASLDYGVPTAQQYALAITSILTRWTSAADMARATLGFWGMVSANAQTV